jgi:hypothetical protein
MKIERQDGETILRLDSNETRLLIVALERATFVDTRPEDQEAAYRLADALAAALSKLAPES